MTPALPRSRAPRPVLAALALALAGACAAPMADIERLDSDEIGGQTPALEIAAQPGTPGAGGFLSALFGTGTEAAASAPVQEAPAAQVEDAPAAGPRPVAPADEDGEMARSVPPAKPSGGFFAALFGGADNARAATAAPAGDDAAVRVVPASLPAPSTAAPAPKSDVPFGTRLPYGEVAKICGVPKSKFGKRIAQHPERNPVYRLYDSDPGNTDPHAFYLTGFADGCARQFTAALAVFGSVGMHEQLRYGLPAEVQPYSDTDKAYEKLKRKVCGVPRRKPCGARIGALENDTVFLSIYERFGGNVTWSNLLLHRGAVLAQDHKKGGEG